MDKVIRDFAHGRHLDVVVEEGLLDTPPRRLAYVCLAASQLSNFEDWVVEVTLHSDGLLFRSSKSVWTMIGISDRAALMMRREFRALRANKSDIVMVSCCMAHEWDADLVFHVLLSFSKCPIPQLRDQFLHQIGVPMSGLPCMSYDTTCAMPSCGAFARHKCKACWEHGVRVLYCSRKCQEAHWTSGHKPVCGLPSQSRAVMPIAGL